MKFLIFLGLLFTVRFSFAIQEIEVVVSDQSFNSSNKVIITEDEIKKSHVNSLATLLSTEANVSIASSNFTPNSIFIRGGDSSHVLFLVDGIPTYDPSTIQRTVNLSTLNLRAIKKIEIIKGSQSVLYGGQALAGVIKIETFPSELKTSTDFVLQGGQAFAEAVWSQQFKLSDTQAFAGNIKLTDAHNPSPAQSSSKTYPQQLTNIDLTYVNRNSWFSSLETILKGQYTNDESQISTYGLTGESEDTENFDITTKALNSSVVFRNKDLFSLSFSQQSTKRTFDQDAVFGGGFATNEIYDGLLHAIRFDLKIFEAEQFKIDSGLSFSHEELYYKTAGIVSADQFQEFEGAFVKMVYKPTTKIVTEAGYRQELSKMISIADTYQFGFSYDEWFKLEHSTGFKTPSLYQQFSTRGNPNLKPEKVISTAMTLENQITENARAAVTLFTSEYKNLITSIGSPSKYQNIDKSETKGIEFYLNYEKMATKAQLSFGYQEPKDLSTNDWLVRRALRTASLKVNHDVNDDLSIGTEVVHTGDRRELYFTFTPPMTFATAGATINGYTLVHFVTNYKVRPDLNIFMRAENIFAQEYQPSYGYFQKDPVVRAGLNYSLD